MKIDRFNRRADGTIHVGVDGSTDLPTGPILQSGNVYTLIGGIEK